MPDGPLNTPDGLECCHCISLEKWNMGQPGSDCVSFLDVHKGPRERVYWMDGNAKLLFTVYYEPCSCCCPENSTVIACLPERQKAWKFPDTTCYDPFLFSSYRNISTSYRTAVVYLNSMVDRLVDSPICTYMFWNIIIQESMTALLLSTFSTFALTLTCCLSGGKLTTHFRNMADI